MKQTGMVLVDSIFCSASSIDHNGKNWMIELKRNQKLLSTSTIRNAHLGRITSVIPQGYVKITSRGKVLTVRSFRKLKYR